MGRFRIALIGLAGLALTLSACGLNAAPPATTSVGPPSSPTPIPIPGGGTVNPTDRIVVYTAATQKSTPSTATAGTATASPTPPSSPQRKVVTYDLTQGKQVSSFSFGSKNDPALGAALAGTDVITATAHKVMLQHLNGSAPRQIYAAPPSGEVLDFDISPDGRLIGIVVRSEASNPQTAVIRVTYLASGGAALTLAVGDPRFGDFQGSFAAVHWRKTTGNQQPVLVVAGGIEDGHPPSSAVITVGGGITSIRPSGIPWLSPGGDTWAMTDQLVCTGDVVTGHHLAVTQVGSTKTEWETTNTTPVYTPFEWSPDGKTLVYLQQPDTGNCKTQAVPGAGLFAVDLASGQSHAIGDLQALHEQWYGSSLVTASCSTGALPVTNRWQHYGPLCPPASSNNPTTVMVGGTKIGQAIDPVPVGVFGAEPKSPPASGSPATS